MVKFYFKKTFLSLQLIFQLQLLEAEYLVNPSKYEKYLK
jgi:hypothetical protein